MEQDWRMHKPLDLSDESFEVRQEIISQDLIIEHIVSKVAPFGMERRFSKLGQGDWYLIYYRVDTNQ